MWYFVIGGASIAAAFLGGAYTQKKFNWYPFAVKARKVGVVVK